MRHSKHGQAVTRVFPHLSYPQRGGFPLCGYLVAFVISAPEAASRPHPSPLLQLSAPDPPTSSRTRGAPCPATCRQFPPNLNPPFVVGQASSTSTGSEATSRGGGSSSAIQLRGEGQWVWWPLSPSLVCSSGFIVCVAKKNQEPHANFLQKNG